MSLWDKQACGKKQDCTRQRKIAKATKRYPSDLTDKEWETLQPLLPGYASQGRLRFENLSIIYVYIDRKRHVAVDSDGRLLLVDLTPANIADSVGAQVVLEGMKHN